MNIALVLSGGTGSRLGERTPKQYLRVNGRMIITYCLETFFKSSDIDIVWIVADPMWQNEIRQELMYERLDDDKFRGFSEPGTTRQLSILNGLRDIREQFGEDALVMIHDGARPMLSRRLIAMCFRGCDGHDGVMPVLPMKDTVYVSEDGKVVSGLLDRQTIFAGQSPEVFKLGIYLKACEVLLPDDILNINGSTEPAIMAGMDIAMVEGDEGNFKITTKADLERFKAIIDKIR